jgi:hypothetical protein
MPPGWRRVWPGQALRRARAVATRTSKRHACRVQWPLPQIPRRRARTALIVARPDGRPWRLHDHKDWERASVAGASKRAAGAFAAAATSIGRADATPYFLRHTYVSPRLAEKRLTTPEERPKREGSVDEALETKSTGGLEPPTPSLRVNRSRLTPAYRCTRGRTNRLHRRGNRSDARRQAYALVAGLKDP